MALGARHGDGFRRDRLYRRLEQDQKSQNKGLSARQKFLLQLAVAVLFITLMRTLGLLTPVIAVPFLNISFEIPWIVYFIFMSFIIVGTDNAVNLTDGLDGLAASVTLVVMAFSPLPRTIWQTFRQTARSCRRSPCCPRRPAARSAGF